MGTWNDVRRKIKAKKLYSSTWASDKKQLIKIIDQAERFELDPGNAERTTISNLQTIVRRARWAIEDNDKERLDGLFHLAADLPLSELRIAIGVHPRVDVPYWRNSTNKETRTYLIEVNPFQLEKIKSYAKPRFLLQEIDRPSPLSSSKE
jgi:hypothetical protein